MTTKNNLEKVITKFLILHICMVLLCSPLESTRLLSVVGQLFEVFIFFHKCIFSEHESHGLNGLIMITIWTTWLIQ